MAAKLTYREQLLHPSWQKRRLESLNAAGWECASCRTADTTLHVHHKRYVKGRMAWEYEDHELQVLCAPCHEAEHANRELLERLLVEANSVGALSTAIGLLGGYLDADLAIEADASEAAKEVDGASYRLGVLANLADGASQSALARAARILIGDRLLNPAQENAIALWESEGTG